MEQLAPSDLTRIRRVVNELHARRERAAKIAEELNLVSKELYNIEFNQLPDLLHELGIETVTLEDGTKLKLTNFYKAAIPKDNPVLRKKAFEWLRANGHEALIRRELTQTFAAGSDSAAQKVIQQLNKLGIPFADRESVHASTLTAFVKEQHGKGNVTLPLEAFGAFIGERVVVKES